jgi:hypothetical protein
LQIFGGTYMFYDTDGDLIRGKSNFDSFLPSSEGFGAMVTVFQVNSFFDGC